MLEKKAQIHILKKSVQLADTTDSYTHHDSYVCEVIWQ